MNPILPLRRGDGYCHCALWQVYLDRFSASIMWTEPNARKKMRRAKKNVLPVPWQHRSVSFAWRRVGGESQLPRPGCVSWRVEESSRSFVSVESTSNSGRRIPVLSCQSQRCLTWWHLQSTCLHVSALEYPFYTDPSTTDAMAKKKS